MCIKGYTVAKSCNDLIKFVFRILVIDGITNLLTWISWISWITVIIIFEFKIFNIMQLYTIALMHSMKLAIVPTWQSATWDLLLIRSITSRFILAILIVDIFARGIKRELSFSLLVVLVAGRLTWALPLFPGRLSRGEANESSPSRWCNCDSRGG